MGKYLSPKLYVTYGIGLFEPINIFRVRYLLSDKWTLKAKSGEGTSATLSRPYRALCGYDFLSQGIATLSPGLRSAGPLGR